MNKLVPSLAVPFLVFSFNSRNSKQTLQINTIHLIQIELQKKNLKHLLSKRWIKSVIALPG